MNSINRLAIYLLIICSSKSETPSAITSFDILKNNTNLVHATPHITNIIRNGYAELTNNQIQELPILKSSIPFPKEFYPALKTCIDRWSLTPELSETAGRYSSTYISKAVKALGLIDSSITFSAFDGGPLRIQGSDSNLMILVFPQTAAPIPHLPDWFAQYATTCSAP